MEIEWIRHKSPVLEIYTKNPKKGGKLLKTVDLKPFSHGELHDLVERELFEVKPEFRRVEEKAQQEVMKLGEEEASPTPCIECHAEEPEEVIDTFHEAHAGTTTINNAHAGPASVDAFKMAARQKNLRELEDDKDVGQQNTAALMSITPFIFTAVLFVIAVVFYVLFKGSGQRAKEKNTSVRRVEYWVETRRDR